MPANTRHTHVAIGAVATLVCGLGLIGSLVPSSSSPTPAPTTASAPSAPETSDIPEGWKATKKDGVFWRWCTDGCDSSKVIGDAGYVIAEVWCRDTACGDIYGRVNLINEQGTVVGWTNDTAYGDVGQKVLLTFDSYQDFKSAQLTELNIRG